MESFEPLQAAKSAYTNAVTDTEPGRPIFRPGSASAPRICLPLPECACADRGPASEDLLVVVRANVFHRAIKKHTHTVRERERESAVALVP